MPKTKVVHGDDLLYRFFMNLFADSSELSSELPVKMLGSMGIWLPLDIYYEMPVLLPWVVRDSTCRGNKAKGVSDQWGAPNKQGYLRDDNSLVKALPRSLTVRTSDAGPLRGARMGTEFVASHIWRIVNSNDLASRIPQLNSFVPNLVWLPAQVSKLSDREGGPVQQALQALSWATYRHAPVAPHLADIVDEAWAILPPPRLSLDTVPELNWFETNPRFLSTRRSRLADVIDALERLADGRPLDKKIITTRYTEGLPEIGQPERAALLEHLKRFRTMGSA